MIHDQWSKTSQLKTKQPCRIRGGTSNQHDRQLQETHNAQMFLQRYLTLRLAEEHKVTNTHAKTKAHNKSITPLENRVQSTWTQCKMTLWYNHSNDHRKDKNRNIIRQSIIKEMLTWKQMNHKISRKKPIFINRYKGKQKTSGMLGINKTHVIDWSTVFLKEWNQAQNINII